MGFDEVKSFPERSHKAMDPLTGFAAFGIFTALLGGVAIGIESWEIRDRYRRQKGKK